MSTTTAKHEEFVSEPIVPAIGTFDSAAMSRGEPGLPGEFTWRDQPYTVARVMSKWKSTGTDRGEVYLRRHWFRIETTTGEHMTLYCQRRTKNPKKPKARWWVYRVMRQGHETQRATLNVQRSTCNAQHSTSNLPHAIIER